MHFLEWNVWIALKSSLKFVPKFRINNIPSLSEPMTVSLLAQKCVTRPQWVKCIVDKWKRPYHNKQLAYSRHTAHPLIIYRISRELWPCCFDLIYFVVEISSFRWECVRCFYPHSPGSLHRYWFNRHCTIAGDIHQVAYFEHSIIKIGQSRARMFWRSWRNSRQRFTILSTVLPQRNANLMRTFDW